VFATEKNLNLNIEV